MSEIEANQVRNESEEQSLKTTSSANDDLDAGRSLPSATKLSRQKLIYILLFIGILATGFYFRFAGLNWDERQHVHPDELFLTGVMTNVSIPDSLGLYFDSQNSPLNPRNVGKPFFVYGDAPILIVRLTVETLAGLCMPADDAPLDATTGRAAPTSFDALMRSLGFDQFCVREDGFIRDLTGFDENFLVGRALSALFDLGTLVWLFLAARRLYGTRIGLLSMAFGAMAVLHIQQSHFFTADAIGTFFVAAAMYFIIRLNKSGSWFDLVAAGIGSGLAIATRINLLPLLGILAIPPVMHAIRDWGERNNGVRVERALSQILIAFAVAILTFRIFMPNAFDGLLSFDQRWSDNMTQIQGMVSGEVSGNPDVQWTNRAPYIFPWINMVFWGLGLPLGLAAWAGWAFAGWKIFGRTYRRSGQSLAAWLRAIAPSKHLLIWVWIAGYFGYTGAQWVKSIRYLLPLYPYMAMFAAWLLVSGWKWARRSLHRPQWLRIGARALPAVVLVATFLWAVAFTEIYRRPESGVAASEWIYDNIPSAATLHYTDDAGIARDLHLQLPAVTTFFGTDTPQITGFRLPTSGELNGITFRELADPGDEYEIDSLTLLVSEDPSGTRPISQAVTDNIFGADEELLEEFGVDFLPTLLSAGVDYYVMAFSDSEDEPLDFAAQLVVERAGNFDFVQATSSADLPRGILKFNVSQDSMLNSASIRDLRGYSRSEQDHLLQVKIAFDPGATEVIAQTQIDVPAGALPASYSASFDAVHLDADREYFFVGATNTGPLLAKSSTLANEHWDRGIPFRTGGRDGFSFYTGFEIANYDDDTPEKLARMLGWLDSADYLFLATNRLYGSIPRQPLRYPLTSEYYRLLFTGELGFDLVKEFTSYPTLGPFQFVDQETTQALGLWPDPTRLPEAGVVLVNMPPAEEAFTVYDHPRILIFQKRPDFSLDDVTLKLGRFDLEAAYHGFKPRDETAAPTGLLLDEQAWETQQVSGTWSELYNRDSVLNTSPGIGMLAGYLVVALLGWAVFPILFVTLPGLADRGYGLSRTLGLLLVSFVVWFAANFRVLPFTRESILLVVVGLVAVGALIARTRWDQIREFIRANKRLILTEEAVFAAAFLLFLALRFANPDLWHPGRGGEKPMDFAYFNAVLKSQYFPPYDPWYAGGFLVYYYYGWVMLGTVTKLLGIVPAIAYNFAVPLVFGLAATATFSVAHGLASRFGARQTRQKVPEPDEPPGERSLPIVVGVIAVVFVMLIGNLGEVKLITDELAKVGETELNTTIPALKTGVDAANGLFQIAFNGKAIAIPTDWWYWNPTRIIPPAEGEAGPITEFPFFTFLYADLHAHMMALPITIVVLGIALSWVLRVPLPRLPQLQDASGQVRNRLTSWLRENWAGILSLGLGGLAVGALRATNTPDLPTYLGMGFMALAFGTWAAQSLKDKSTWLGFVVRVLLFAAFYFVLFSPFSRSDRLGVTRIEGWTGSTTVLWAYIFVHGIFLFPILTYLYIEMRQWGLRWMRALWNDLHEWRALLVMPLVIAVLASIYFALRGVSILVVAAPVMAVSFIMMLRPRLPAATRFWMLLVFLALALSFAVEVVVFSGDIGRMNMVFKFYYQIWVLLGISAAVSLGWLWNRSHIDLSRLNGGWRVTVVALVASGLLYTPFAARAKVSERFYEGAPPGLDGMAYMPEAVFNEYGNEMHLRWDYEALTWMQDNVAGTPVVAEGRSRHEYLWGSRVSIYTGLPTLLGWGHHQRQQRGVVSPGSVMQRRTQDVELLFNDLSIVTTHKILDRYGVKYIYVGQLEKGYYSAESLAKFDRMVDQGSLLVAYQNPGVTIYEVVGG